MLGMEPENYIPLSSWKVKKNNSKEIVMDSTTQNVKKRKLEDPEVDDTSRPKKKLIMERQKDLSEKAAAKKLKAMMSTDISLSTKRRLRRLKGRLRAGGLSKPSDPSPMYPNLTKTGRRKLRTLRKQALEKGLSFNEEYYVKQQELNALLKPQQELEKKASYKKSLENALIVKNGLRSVKRMELKEKKASAANDHNITKDEEYKSQKNARRALKRASKDEKSLMKCGNEGGVESVGLLKQIKSAKKNKESMNLIEKNGASKPLLKPETERIGLKNKLESTSLTNKEPGAKLLSKLEKRKLARAKARKIKWDAKQETLTGANPKDTKLAEKKQRFVLFAGNLPYDSTTDELVAHFSSGEHRPVSVRMPKDKETKKPRGFAYIEYTNVPGFQFGFTKNLTTLGGRTINVVLSNSGKAKPKEKSRTPQGFSILV